MSTLMRHVFYQLMIGGYDLILLYGAIIAAMSENVVKILYFII